MSLRLSGLFLRKRSGGAGIVVVLSKEATPSRPRGLLLHVARRAAGGNGKKRPSFPFRLPLGLAVRKQIVEAVLVAVAAAFWAGGALERRRGGKEGLSP